MTTKYGITQLPLGYPVFYVGSKDEWVSENEFASKMPKLFSQFIQNKVEEKMLVAFTNSKVATGGVGTALLFVYVSDKFYPRKGNATYFAKVLVVLSRNLRKLFYS